MISAKKLLPFYILGIVFQLAFCCSVFAATGDLKNIPTLKGIHQGAEFAITPTNRDIDDARIMAITKRLSRRIGGIKTGLEQAASKNSFSAPAESPLTLRLNDSSSDEMEVVYRQPAGTPRQIKPKVSSKGEATVLQKATTQAGPVLERDTSTAMVFLERQRNLLRIKEPRSEFKLQNHWSDELGRRHIRYSQTYKGLNVWPCELTVHLDEAGNVNLVNGAFVPTPHKTITQPVVNSEEALIKARGRVPVGEKGEVKEQSLIIYAPGDRIPRLAWKVQLYVSAESYWMIVIDALNGEVLTAYNQIAFQNVSGSGQDLFGTAQNINVWLENGLYYAVDTSKPMYSQSSDPPRPDSTKGAIIVLDLKNAAPEGNFTAYFVTSQNPNTGWLPDGISLAFTFSKTYDYFLSTHNRNSIDNSGANMLGFVRTGTNYENAFYSLSDNGVFFGDKYTYAGALDVVAHEVTHGVTRYSCNLIYQDQSGALNEAFSDIFGEMVEDYAGGSCDWIHGTLTGNPKKRNLLNPSSVKIADTNYYYPDKMSLYYSRNSPLLQQFVDQDYGGVHLNCTIVAHAFYLLAEGLQGAIGKSKAAKIFYRAQNNHLVQNSQFMDARLAAVESAGELYGYNSQEVSKVKEAFDHVEIFEQAATPPPPPVPAVTGSDAVLALRIWWWDGQPYLVRRDPSLSDPAGGVWLGNIPTAATRPSVSGDGSFALFVNDLNDACGIVTSGDDSTEADCFGYAGEVYSISLSPDSSVLALVVLDEFGEPINKIGVAKINGNGGEDDIKIYDLVAPATEGFSVNTVKYADSMDISADNRYLIYDAYNILELENGGKIGAWSIYMIDLLRDQTFALLPPVTTGDICYPSFSQTTSHIITFEFYDNKGNTYIYTGNLLDGRINLVQTVTGTSSYSVPCFAGDDSAIIYTVPDVSSLNTGRSLWRQPLNADLLTPAGSSLKYLDDAASGVVYRRGTFSSPVPNIQVSENALLFGEVRVGGSTVKSVTITNTGAANLEIISTSLGGTNAADFFMQGGCNGQVLPPTGTCEARLVFSPKSVGPKSSALTVSSNDSDTPAFQISLSGKALQAALGEIIYVDQAGSCNGNLPCYRFIQEAVQASGALGTIFIAEGIYDEHLMFAASKSLWLRGGFNASYSATTGMSSVKSVTILDGTTTLEMIGLK